MNDNDTVETEGSTLTILPVELLHRILSFLPLEDQLNVPSVCKCLRDASYEAVTGHVCFNSIKSAHAARGRTWRPVKALVVLWFHRRRNFIRSLAIRDAIKPFSDEDGPALILPVVAANLWQLQLQVHCVCMRGFWHTHVFDTQRCTFSTMPLISLCTQLRSLSITLMPDSVSNSDVDLRWLKHLDSLDTFHLELPPSSSTASTFDGLSALKQLCRVSLSGAQLHHLRDLDQLPSLTTLQLLRYRGTQVPNCVGACWTLQQLTLELHNIPMQSEADVSCLSTLRGLTDLTLRTSRPARLHVASLKALRASLPDLLRLRVAFCNYHWPPEAAGASIPCSSPQRSIPCRVFQQGRPSADASKEELTT